MKKARKIAARISLVYLLIGGVWIVGTDSLSLLLAESNLRLYFIFQQYKGWIYVIVTGFILYRIIIKRTMGFFQSRDELNKKDEQYQSLFNHNPDAVFEFNLDGTFKAVNPAALEVLGYREEDLYNKRVNFLLDELEIGAAAAYFQQAAQGRSSKFELSIKNAQGGERLLRCSFLPSKINGQVYGVYAIARDITEFRRNEERMIISEKLSVIGHLAAAVAHEIRNPLTSIKGFLQLMRDSKEVNEFHIEIMQKEIERIHIISSELLFLGKNQAVVFERQDIKGLIHQVLTLMEIQANLEHVELVYESSSGEPLWICGDSAQLKQVLINLIKNSLEAVDNSGKVVISAGMREGKAAVTIEDNGIGMEEERMERIGEPFYSTKEKGTGLGLAVCQKIIHRHNGSLHFSSVKGEGTVVTILLPLAEQGEP